MCPHTTVATAYKRPLMYVSSYYFMCPNTTIYVLILPYICPHTPPHTPIYTYICSDVRVGPKRRFSASIICVSSYYCIGTTRYVSS